MRLLFIVLLTPLFCFSQQLDEKSIYATMATKDALSLQKDFPEEIDILDTNANEAAVFMTNHASHKLHDRVLVHGPGYMYQPSREAVLQRLHNKKRVATRMIDFSITENELVAQAMNAINTSNIETHITELEAYGTRHHTTASGAQASQDLKEKWEAIAAEYERDDVSVRLYNHNTTNMPSVIMTIEGAETPDEYVIVGGHLDSTSSQSQTNAPGADDDASGIATITEATRALFEIGFVPKKTIEIMAYSAEEIGLVGSAEIANEYASTNIDVEAVVQFDMTLYNGSANDVSFITDFTNATLNNYLMELLDFYNASGDHQISYGTSLCNYGCSDHASWTAAGYMASFPFEANFGAHNSNIHTPGDTFSVTGTASHAAKFAKLCATFLIEATKSNAPLSVSEAIQESVFVTTATDKITYAISLETTPFKSVVLYDISGKIIQQQTITQNRGSLVTSQLASGLYIVSFVTANDGIISKRVVLK